MKEKSPASSGGGRLGGRKPQQNKSRSGSVKTGQRPAWEGKGPAKGKGGFSAENQAPWRKDKPAAGPRGTGPYRKDSGRRNEPGFEKRYSRPGSRDTYQPRQDRGRPEPGMPSPASQRFGPGSDSGFSPQPRRAFRPAPPPQEVGEGPYQPAQEAIPAGINLLTGRNPIREAIKTGRDLEKLMVAKGDISGSARQIVSMAREAGVLVQFVERRRLDQIVQNHQGMVAYASAYQYASLDEIFQAAKDQGQPPFVVILDQLTDPHNLGAVIRTAVCAGAHGVIVPTHRAVGLTPAAVKASAGAVEHIKVVRVGNLNQTIKKLKEKGLWIYAADQAGEDYRKAKITGPCALVIGSEGEGISPLTLTLCDHRLKIPMSGTIGSLNASVAAGILMYAVFTSRNPLP